MPSPLARAAHLLYRYFAGFLLILFILWGGWHVKGQLADLSDKESLHQYLLDKGAELSKDISAAKEETVNSTIYWKRAENEELARQISQLSAEIEQKTSKVLALDNIANTINPTRQLEIARLNAEIALATQKRDYLLRIKEYRLGQTECSRITNNCETIRQRHVFDFSSYQQTVTQLVPLQESWQAQYNALSQEYGLRENLEERRDALALKTQAHKANYAQCLASAQKDCSRKEPPPFALNSVAIDQAQANLQQITRELGDELTRHWLKSAVLDPIRAVLPMAIQVFIAALLGKLGIKFLLYFVLAPSAAHGRAICLVPNARSRQTASLIRSPDRSKFDVDAVCQVDLTRIAARDPIAFFDEVGKALQPLSPTRKNRCWNVDFTGDPFYLEFTPSVPLDTVPAVIREAVARQYIPVEPYRSTALAVVDNATRQWKTSNPAGMTKWVNDTAKLQLILSVAFESATALDKALSIEPVPEQDVEITDTLKVAIRLFKRHRDMCVHRQTIDKDFKPISIIIVTLLTSCYAGLAELGRTYNHPVELLAELADLLPGMILELDGKYRVDNPTVEGENFAEKWNQDDGERYEAFHTWCDILAADMRIILAATDPQEIRERVRSIFGCGGNTSSPDSSNGLGGSGNLQPVRRPPSPPPRTTGLA